MTRDEQKALLTSFCNAVRDELLKRSDRWPESWDGHELRELAAAAFEYERTSLMCASRSKRRRDCRNDILVNNLY